MTIPAIRGVIARRILVNYHVAPEVLAPLLPAPFRPKIVQGVGIVGICLIRMSGLRPTLLPAWLGLGSENAAHRTAVEWDEGGAVREGVYIRRRDTSSRLSTWAGGRLFPGIHHHARFTVRETPQRFDVAMASDDGAASLRVVGTVAPALSATSVFKSLDEASAFFRAGSLGYSASTDTARFQGLELQCRTWKVEPLAVEDVRSSFFEDVALFPKGSVAFDCALLMRGIDHEWHAKVDLCCGVEAGGRVGRAQPAGGARVP